MSSFQDTLQQGATIGCYQIEEVLGRGGFAVTYLAIDSNLDVYVAIKEYLPKEITTRDATGVVTPRDAEFADDYQTGLENFAREAKTLALFKHPNIVRVHQVLHENNTAYMVMDYEHGQELAEVLETRKSLSEQQLRPILMPVLDAVTEIHRQGYVHRDIKPSNIYLRDNGSPVLLDFGAARYTLSETTQQLTAVVTVGYTPIEQYNVSDADQGPWTDIYALSAVLYEAVTGQMPVDSVTRASTALTSAPDPLVSVRDKSLQPCSDEFYKAIDWGLRMDALERPRSVNQWLTALNGTVESEEPASLAIPADQKSARAVRPSKLRTRAKSLAATETDEHQRTSVELAMQDFDIEPYQGSRIEPSFGNSIDEIDLDSVDTHGQNFAAVQSVQPELAVAGVAAGSRESTPGEPEVLLRDSYRPDNQSRVAAPASAARTPVPQNAGDRAMDRQVAATKNGAKSHTQEIRDVVRRDIMKRDVDFEDAADDTDAIAEPATPLQTSHHHTQLAGTPSPMDAQRRPGRILTRSAVAQDEQSNPRHNDLRIRSDSMEIDQSDWDYEPPGRPSRWRWLLPATGLAAVFAASLLYVNRPDLFQFNNPDLPELTVDAALDRAGEKVYNGQLIFPAGESALDYYQLVLGSEPNNPEALAGIRQIESQVRDDIVKNVENNSLSEANRLLSRANNAGLRVDSIPSAGAASITASQEAVAEPDRVTAIDKDLSPYLKGRIEEIEQHIANGDAVTAAALFAEADKYLPDAELSVALAQRIDALRVTETDDSSSQNIAAAETSVLAGIDTQLQSTAPPVTNTLATATPYPNAEIPARAATSADLATSETADTDAAVDETPAPAVAVIPTSPANDYAEPKPAAPVSAPRRSYIDGRGESARHLNTLRTAIEAKSIDRVLQVSDDLPRERVDFLNQMFRRYDRLDVVIDRIRDQSGQLTANLNVAMFNRRGDGSYYSAGRWNGVTVKSSRVDDQWEKIEW